VPSSFARGATVLLAVALGLSLAPPAAASSAGSPARQLAARYAPVLAVEPQPEPCGSGEAYRPTSVDVVLGRRSVTLRGPDGEVVKRAPTAADLFGRGEGYYLDLPGDPLDPGCTYETHYRRWSAGRKPSVYAHLARDPRHPHKLALQYWLYYMFNDFTDKHESDWEMLQVDFAAANVKAALRGRPYEVDVAQHAGGERSAWRDPKLQRRGTHPLINVATGSHASVGPSTWADRFRGVRLRRHPGRHGDCRAAGRAAGQGALLAVLPRRLARLPRPLGSAGLLLLTDNSLNFINIAGSIVYALTVPYAIALTLYYFDLGARGAPAARPAAAK
jgi:hypothetical protein